MPLACQVAWRRPCLPTSDHRKTSPYLQIWPTTELQPTIGSNGCKQDYRSEYRGEPVCQRSLIELEAESLKWRTDNLIEFIVGGLMAKQSG